MIRRIWGELTQAFDDLISVFCVTAQVFTIIMSASSILDGWCPRLIRAEAASIEFPMFDVHP